MYKFLTKNGLALAFLIGAVLTLIFYVMVLGGLPTGFDDPNFPKEDRFNTGVFDFGLMAMVALTVIAVIVLIFFALYQLAVDPKRAMKGLIGVAALVGIMVVTYFMADGTVTEKWSTELGVTENISKFVGAGITTTFVLLFVSLGAFLFFELRNFFK